MNPRKWIPPAFLATALLAANVIVLAAIIPAGCEGLCNGRYEHCTTEKNLRYVMCSEFRHEFSDGETFDDEEDAFRYCYCPFIGENCNDGRTADLCTRSDYNSRYSGDLEDTAIFSDGAEETFVGGYKICHGYESCYYEDLGCDEGGWYLLCDNGGNDTYIMADGTTTADEDVAVDSCTWRD